MFSFYSVFSEERIIIAALSGDEMIASRLVSSASLDLSMVTVLPFHFSELDSYGNYCHCWRRFCGRPYYLPLLLVQDEDQEMSERLW